MQEYTSKLDEIDLQILREMQVNGRLNNSELARRINLSQPATHARLKRLETLGIIRQHVSLLDRDKLGLDLICFFHIKLQGHGNTMLDRFENIVRGWPNVLECHFLTGQFDYLLKAVFRSRHELEQFERHTMRPLADIDHVMTSLVLSEIKATTVLPLPD